MLVEASTLPLAKGVDLKELREEIRSGLFEDMYPHRFNMKANPKEDEYLREITHDTEKALR